ncbi:unnamed protein product [Somion occarium]|uniref:RRM Nup35-type domain-containing protein n=1 Tax=Somion occarium TaxID=3059160 RepID=A0ABP1E4B0_9APHY
MYNPTYSSTPGQDYNNPSSRPPHNVYGQPFTVAGMASPGTTHSPSLRGGPLSSGSGLNVSGMGGSLGDSLAQSRSHYQPGYLMSMSQTTNASQQHQRHDDVPIVQTKATLNNILSSASASDFGMGSMFESSRERQRQTWADEDAPPTASVNDIVNEVYTETPSKRQPQSHLDASIRPSLFRPTQTQVPTTPKSSTSAPNVNKLIYVIVFGYPPDKYTATVDYFKSLGESTEPDPNVEIVNCFRIGYSNPTDAMRAVRKNGDVIGGCWMVGAKWADSAQAESILGPALARSSLSFSPDASTADVSMLSSSPPASQSGFPSTFASPDGNLALTSRQRRDSNAGTPSVGTPIRLAPSTSAFRKAGAGGLGGTPGKHKVGESVFGAFPSIIPVTPQAGGAANQSPSKGVLGQVSDMIFGW